ncbi:hypothetical protein LTR84_003858 [Exophiala bonariae]|uniref:CsbD-like domain-containing protein n=1 Tax=Exophiala bonariae TaxID=1690606 RepID=A0AAV9N6E8_9EURO|nr:hypothetical protein LTR84_003858 [Exophiala bonariae]
MPESQNQGPVEDKENLQPQGDGQGEGAHWASKPESYGNAAGEKIEETLAPVSKYTGKGLETLGRPIGGLVEPLVGGVMKGGKAWGEETGVGYGNAEGGPAKAAEAEGQRMKEPFGGKEQNAENPLGL